MDELTSRETHIARLIADGMHDRAIATHLRLSLRTIENDLSSIYAKLQVTSRGQLALALKELAPPGG